MPVTRTVLYSNTIVSGGTSAAIVTGWSAAAGEVLYNIDVEMAVGLKTEIQLRDSAGVCMDRREYYADNYHVAGSLGRQGGYYSASKNNQNSLTFVNHGAESAVVTLYYVTIPAPVTTYIKKIQNINSSKMFEKSDIKRLIELASGRPLLENLEPCSFRFNSQPMLNAAINANYIYFGQIDCVTTGLGIGGVIRITAALLAPQAPNMTGTTQDIYMRYSYDALAPEYTVRNNVMFNSMTVVYGGFEAVFVGYRVKVT